MLRVPRLTVVVGLSAGPLPRGRSPACPPVRAPVPQARPILTHLACVFLRDAQCFAGVFFRNEQTRSRAPPPRFPPDAALPGPSAPLRARLLCGSTRCPGLRVPRPLLGPASSRGGRRHRDQRPDGHTTAARATRLLAGPRGRAGAACPADSAVRCVWLGSDGRTARAAPRRRRVRQFGPSRRCRRLAFF